MPNTTRVIAGTTAIGIVNVSLKQELLENFPINISCTMTGIPIEREELGPEYIEPFSKSGTLRRVNSIDTKDFWKYKENITKVVFEDTINLHETTDDLIFDVSENKDGSVMSYVVPNAEDSTTYTVYIQSETGVKGNKDSAYLFYKFSNLKTIEGLEHFDTSNVTTFSRMFYSCSSLAELDVSKWNTSKVTSMNDMFYSCIKLVSLEVSQWSTSQVTDMSSLFKSCSGLVMLNIKDWDTSQVIDMNYMFSQCANLVTLDISKWRTDNVTNMSFMFDFCFALTSLDLNKWNTGNVTDMSHMFYYCKELKALNINLWNTRSVTDMSSIFALCSNLLEFNINNWDISQTVALKFAFQSCRSLTVLDLSKWNTRNVSNMSKMFDGCKQLTSLNISNFDTSQVTDMSYMFDSCSKLSTTITIRGSKCQSYTYMFSSSATATGAKIIVNYTNDASNIVDQMLATKSTTSNVVKGSALQEYSIIINDDTILADTSTAYANRVVTLSSKLENHGVVSFKMNGTLIKGNEFTMPSEDVTITDIKTIEQAIIESEHNPYPNGLNNQIIGEKTYEGASSLTVTLDYETEGTSYDYIYLYDNAGKQYGKYGGKTRKTETIIIPGNYIKITFRTDSSGNNYYGFKAIITPNYD